VAQVVNASGQPVANVPVVFRVTAQDGTLGPTHPGLSDIAVNTNAQGQASVQFTLGTHAGAGNNLVEASTTGVPATAVFSASATSTGATLINADSGNNQFGVVGQSLPLPFIAVVTDAGHNRIPGVPVTFTIKQGKGNINGQPSATLNSDGDGRVEIILTLGPDAGINNNLVEATFPGGAAFPATFTATGRTLGPAAATAISGVVLDNSNQPIPGVTMRLFQLNQGPSGNLPQQVGTPVQTDGEGQFTIQPAPVGVFKLMADGGTATRPGVWPTLEYDIITTPGQNNTVGSPIYLPQLNPDNKLCITPSSGGTLTVPQVPGFSLTIAPGSATFPGGSHTGCVTVTPVNMDKVPMVPGFGQQPRFVVTIQPMGTMFNPPAAMTIPNVDGLAPRAVTEMYSYDHDLASFVAIGTATVSDDGSVIRSDPGVGVLKAGWHCGGDPNQAGGAAPVQVSITSDPAPKVEVGKTVTITASGSPSPGTYSWSSSDTNIATIQSSNAGTAVIQAVGIGTATITVTYTCSSGATATATVKVKVTTADIVVIGWVDASVIPLPSGANILLRADLNLPLTCDALVGEWALLGIRVDIFSQADVDYANAYLLSHSGNNPPPATIDPDSVLAGGDFRLYNRFQATFDQSGGTISNLSPIQSKTQVGKTPNPCTLPIKLDGETFPSSGASGITPSGTAVYQLAEGRLGPKGQAANKTLNGTTTPWIWSVIRFDASGSPDTSDHSIFPTFYVYKDGSRIAIYPQSAPAAFIVLSDTYQRLPSDIQ